LLGESKEFCPRFKSKEKRFNTEGTEDTDKKRRTAPPAAGRQKWLSHLGAGFGGDGFIGVGVEFVEYFAVVLFYDAAF
jgi:hypothetical protein